MLKCYQIKTVNVVISSCFFCRVLYGLVYTSVLRVQYDYFSNARPIKFLIYDVDVSIPVVDAKTPYWLSCSARPAKNHQSLPILCPMSCLECLRSWSVLDGFLSWRLDIHSTGQPRCQLWSSKGTSICLAGSSLSLTSLNVPGCLLLRCSFPRIIILSCLKMSPSRSCWYIQYALFLIAMRKRLLSELTGQVLSGNDYFKWHCQWTRNNGP